MPVDANEAVVFVIALLGLAPVIVAYARYRSTSLFFLGYVALLVGAAATIAESFVLPDVLNVVEHGVGIALAGALFAWAAVRSHTRTAALLREVRNDLWAIAAMRAPLIERIDAALAKEESR